MSQPVAPPFSISPKYLQVVKNKNTLNRPAGHPYVWDVLCRHVCVPGSRWKEDFFLSFLSDGMVSLLERRGCFI